MAELNLSANAASLQSGLSRETVRKILSSNTKMPDMETIVKLSSGLQTTVDMLIYGKDLAVEEREAPRETTYADEEVEIKAVAAGSSQGAFQLFDTHIGRAPLPRGLKKYPDVYALIIINDSMVPEHKPGQVRFATPSVRPKLGDTVVIEFERDPDVGPEAMIGHLLKNGAQIRIGKLNPVSDVEIDSSHVTRLHRLATETEVTSM